MTTIHITIAVLICVCCLYSIVSMSLRWRRCSKIVKRAALLEQRWRNAEVVDSKLIGDTTQFWEETRVYLRKKYRVSINNVSFNSALSVARTTGAASPAGDVCDILLALGSLEISFIGPMMNYRAPRELP